MTRHRSVRSGFEQRFLASLRRCGIEQGERLIVGFSGGPDSLAAALALRRVAPLLDLTAVLVHIDHGLRPASDLDAARCRELAGELGFAFQLLELAPDLTQRADGRGIEEQARRERYLALGSAALDWDTRTILLGHQADDQAETVLLHLFRGSGLRGLGGMRPVETRTIPWWDETAHSLGEFQLLRPLLAERRETIETYVDELGATPIQDESNASEDFDRNWIRHRVLPAIETRWPSAVETITRSAEAIRLDSDYLDQLGRTNQAPNDPNDRTLCSDELLMLDRALAFRKLIDWLLLVGVDEPGFDVVARLYDFVRDGNESVSIQVGDKVAAALSNGRLLTFADLFAEAVSDVPLHSDDRSSRWRIEIADSTGAAEGWVAFAKRGDATVRTLRPGDRWTGTKRKVMDDLRVAGVHPLLRRSVLAVTDDTGVLLIPAIYPTIHTIFDGGDVTMGWVRWRKV